MEFDTIVFECDAEPTLLTGDDLRELGFTPVSLLQLVIIEGPGVQLSRQIDERFAVALWNALGRSEDEIATLPFSKMDIVSGYPMVQFFFKEPAFIQDIASLPVIEFWEAGRKNDASIDQFLLVFVLYINKN